MEAGVDRYVLQHDSVDEMLAQIWAASCSEALVSPGMAAALMSRRCKWAQLLRRAEAIVVGSAQLTPREIEIMGLNRVSRISEVSERNPVWYSSLTDSFPQIQPNANLVQPSTASG